LSEHRKRADSIEDWIVYLEAEIHQNRKLIRDLIALLEKEFGRDIDGDGEIGLAR